MTSPDIEEALEVIPATIHLVSGREIRVTNRKMVLVSPSAVVLVLDDTRALKYIASYNIESETHDAEQKSA
jgi:hypothetical protein